MISFFFQVFLLVGLSLGASAAEMIRGGEERAQIESVLRLYKEQGAQVARIPAVIALETALLGSGDEQVRQQYAHLIEQLIADADWPSEFSRLRALAQQAHALGLLSTIPVDLDLNFDRMRWVNDQLVSKHLLEKQIDLLEAQSRTNSAHGLGFLAAFLGTRDSLDCLQLFLSPVSGAIKDPIQRACFGLHELMGRSYFAGEVAGEEMFLRYIEAAQSLEEVKGELNAYYERFALKEIILLLKVLSKTVDQPGKLVQLDEAGSAVHEIQGFLDREQDQDHHPLPSTVSDLYEASLRSLFSKEFSWGKSSEELAYALRLEVACLVINQKGRLGDEESSELNKMYENLRLSSSGEEFQRATHPLDLFLQRHLEKNASKYSADILVSLAPLSTAMQLGRYYRELVGSMNRLAEQFQKSQTYLQSKNESYNASVIRQIQSVKVGAAMVARSMMQSKDINTIINAFVLQERLSPLLELFSEAVMQRYSTVDNYGELLSRKLLEVRTQPHLKVFSREVNQEVQKLIRKDGDEALSNIYYNPRHVIVLGASFLAVGHLISFRFAEFSKTAAWVSGLGRAMVIGQQVTHLFDRLHQEGADGLFKLDSLVDILSIASLSPRAMPRFDGQIGLRSLWSRLRNGVGILQQSSGRLLVAVLGSMGVYETVWAESVAKGMRRQGFEVSERDVRARGIKNLALAGMFYLHNKHVRRLGVKKYGRSYSTKMSRFKFRNSSLADRIGLNGPRTMDFYRRFNQADLVGKIGVFGRGTWLLGTNAFLVSEAVLAGYTTPDFWFDQKVRQFEPLPDLGEGESAVIATGFSQAEIFYVGAKSESSHAAAFEKYGARLNGNLDFLDPDDFFEGLYRHALEHGPIRYLKISSHGIPGGILTPNAFYSPQLPGEKGYFDHVGEEGYINLGYLRKNRDQLRRMMATVMAPDARVLINACLVGANYENFDSDTFGDDIGMANIGDAFLDEFAEIMLPHGGRLDASNRMLFGLNSPVGSLVFESERSSLFDEFGTSKHRAPIIPLSLYRIKDNGMSEALKGRTLFEASQLETADNLDLEMKLESVKVPLLPHQLTLSDADHGGGKRAANVAGRFYRIVTNLNDTIYRYGVHLEGGFWGERYNFRIVNP